MIVKHLTNLEEAAPLRGRWNELSDGIPFRQWEWLATWWKHFGNGRKLCLLVVENDRNEVIGFAPWYFEPNPISGRTLRFLGSGTVCSDHLTVLSTLTDSADVGKAIADWLIASNAENRDCTWDLLQLEGVNPDQEVLRSLFANLTTQGCTTHNQASIRCWKIPLSPTWQEYLQSLPKSHRKHMRQVERKFQEDVQLLVAHDETSWNRIWDRFVDLHQRRRTSLGQPGCFQDSSFESFLRSAAQQLFELQQARLLLVESAGTPISTLLLLCGRQAAYAYQMGTNPDMMSASPGWLVVGAAVQTGIDNQECALDLLRGDEPYKARMGAVPIEFADVRIVPPQLGSKLRHTAWATGTKLKSWIKRGLSAAGLTTVAS